MFPALDTYVADWKDYSLGFAGWESPPLESDLDPAELTAVYVAVISSGNETPFISSAIKLKAWVHLS